MIDICSSMIAMMRNIYNGVLCMRGMIHGL